MGDSYKAYYEELDDINAISDFISSKTEFLDIKEIWNLIYRLENEGSFTAGQFKDLAKARRTLEEVLINSKGYPSSKWGQIGEALKD